MQALIICINYHSTESTLMLIKNLLKLSENLKQDNSPTIMIVNNSAESLDDKTFSSVDLPFKNVLCVNCPENLGYFGGAQKGFEVFLQSNPLPDWVIISNTDIKIKDPLFFEKLFSIASPQASVIAPSIISSKTGCDQNPMLIKRPSKLRMHFYKYVFSFYWSWFFYQLTASIKKTVQLLQKTKIPQELPLSQKIYAPNGAFLVFHNNYFSQGGSFKHGAFLYGEEITVAEFCLQKKLEILYNPELQVFHVESESTSIIPKKKLHKFYAQANAYLADTFFH